MIKSHHSTFPIRVRWNAIAQATLGLLCLSSPLFLTSASWAQFNGQDIRVNVPLNGNSQPTANLGAAAVPVLIQVLQGKQAPSGFDATSAIPILIQGIQGNNPQIRSDAAAAVPGIIQALQNQNPQLQQQVQQLGQPNAQQNPQPNPQPNPQLNTQPKVQSNAGRCFVSNPGSVVPALIGGLQNQDELVRFFAGATLGCLGDQAKGAAPALLTSLTDPNQAVRLVAAFALDKIGIGIQQAAKSLSAGQLNQLVSTFSSSLGFLADPLINLPQNVVNSLFNTSPTPQQIQQPVQQPAQQPVQQQIQQPVQQQIQQPR
ncbi:MAG: HEAT repeat domain-containing protein [Hapalosiphonaceae cyanobacterium JJU2]|nr:MAG: HEAT repeat domain-containing protein [Hapalosiphonaceae cyanobacterium JJU2]